MEPNAGRATPGCNDARAVRRAWVMEYVPEPGSYVTSEQLPDGAHWSGTTRDIRKAIQYCRRVDAERSLEFSNKQDFRAIEVEIGKGGRRV